MSNTTEYTSRDTINPRRILVLYREPNGMNSYKILFEWNSRWNEFIQFGSRWVTKILLGVKYKYVSAIVKISLCGTQYFKPKTLSLQKYLVWIHTKYSVSWKVFGMNSYQILFYPKSILYEFIPNTLSLEQYLVWIHTKCLVWILPICVWV